METLCSRQLACLLLLLLQGRRLRLAPLVRLLDVSLAAVTNTADKGTLGKGAGNTHLQEHLLGGWQVAQLSQDAANAVGGGDAPCLGGWVGEEVGGVAVRCPAGAADEWPTRCIFGPMENAAAGRSPRWQQGGMWAPALGLPPWRGCSAAPHSQFTPLAVPTLVLLQYTAVQLHGMTVVLLHSLPVLVLLAAGQTHIIAREGAVRGGQGASCVGHCCT